MSEKIKIDYDEIRIDEDIIAHPGDLVRVEIHIPHGFDDSCHWGFGYVGEDRVIRPIK